MSGYDFRKGQQSPRTQLLSDLRIRSIGVAGMPEFSAISRSCFPRIARAEHPVRCRQVQSLGFCDWIAVSRLYRKRRTSRIWLEMLVFWPWAEIPWRLAM